MFGVVHRSLSSVIVRPFLLWFVIDYGIILCILRELPSYHALPYHYIPPEYTYTESLDLVTRSFDENKTAEGTLAVYGSFLFDQTLVLSSVCTQNRTDDACPSLLTDTQYFSRTITSLFENTDIEYVSLHMVRGHYPSYTKSNEAKDDDDDRVSPPPLSFIPRIHQNDIALPVGLSIEIRTVKNRTSSSYAPPIPLDTFSFRNELGKLNILSCASIGGSIPAVRTGSGGSVPGSVLYPLRLWYSYPCIYQPYNTTTVRNNSYCMNIPTISICNEQFITLFNELLPCHLYEKGTFQVPSDGDTTSSFNVHATSPKVGLGSSLLHLPTLLDTNWLAFTIEAKAVYCTTKYNPHTLCSLHFRSRISRTWLFSSKEIEEYTSTKINIFGTLFWGKEVTRHIRKDQQYVDDELCPVATDASILTINEEGEDSFSNRSLSFCTAAQQWLPLWYQNNRIHCRNSTNTATATTDTTETSYNDEYRLSNPSSLSSSMETLSTTVWFPDCITIHRRYSSLHYGYGNVLYTITSSCNHHPYGIRIYEVLPWMFTRIENSYTIWKEVMDDRSKGTDRTAIPDKDNNSSEYSSSVRSELVFNVSIRQLHPAVERGIPEVIELGSLYLNTYERMYLQYRVQIRSILHVDEYPPNANHGIVIPGSKISICTTAVKNTTDGDKNQDTIHKLSLLSSSLSVSRLPTSSSAASPFSCYEKVTVPLILDVPLPDFSMPYNVITLISTLLAFTLGTMVNILARVRKKPVK